VNKKMPYIQLLEFEILPGDYKTLSFRQNIHKPVQVNAIEFCFSKLFGEPYLCGQSLLEVLRGNFEIPVHLFRVPVVMATQRPLTPLGYLDFKAEEYEFLLEWQHTALIRKPIGMRMMLFCRAEMEEKNDERNAGS